jgi:hypothetical protein
MATHSLLSTKNEGVRKFASQTSHCRLPYFVKYSADFLYIETDAEIFPAHYTWKVAQEVFKIAFMMNKLAMIISFQIILEK